MNFQFSFYQDFLAPNQSAELDATVRHRQLVVMHGSIELGMQTVAADHGIHFGGHGMLVAGAEGAWVWRCEIVARDTADSVLRAEGVTSTAVLTRPIDTLDLRSGSRWLFRADTTTMPPGMVAHPHAHEGPGVRCLKFGQMRIESRETAATYLPGEAWYESGPGDPVVAHASATQPTVFVRMMLLPPEFFGRRSVRVVDPANGDRPRARSARRVYNDTLIEL